MKIHIAALPELPVTARVVLLLGRRDSDHLRELLRIAEFKGRMAYRIERAEDLQPRWFVGATEVGIVLGASNLEAELRRVTERLRDFAGSEAQGLLEGIAR